MDRAGGTRVSNVSSPVWMWVRVRHHDCSFSVHILQRFIEEGTRDPLGDFCDLEVGMEPTTADILTPLCVSYKTDNDTSGKAYTPQGAVIAALFTGNSH